MIRDLPKEVYEAQFKLLQEESEKAKKELAEFKAEQERKNAKKKVELSPRAILAFKVFAIVDIAVIFLALVYFFVSIETFLTITVLISGLGGGFLGIYIGHKLVEVNKS